MKNECYIVRDLLPSYIDQLCSEETSEFVEQHINTCEQCAQLLHQMKVEFDTEESLEIPVRLEQKKPLQKIAYFFHAQKGFAKFLNISFWFTLLITIGFFIHSFSVFSNLNDDRYSGKLIEEQKQDIMDNVLSVLSSQGVDEQALQTIFDENSAQLQHLAIFSSVNIENVETTNLQDGPTYTFPIDYSKAALIVGENGPITDSIIPNDYDIGTVAMANDNWIVQFEYKDTFLETLENAHQAKYYAPSNLMIFSLPIIFTLITLFVLVAWLFQSRITKPMERMLD